MRFSLLFFFVIGLSIYHHCHKDKTNSIEKARERFGPFIVDYFQLDFPNKYNGTDINTENSSIYVLTKNENAKVLNILKETMDNTTQVNLVYYLDDEGIERCEYILDNHEYFLETIKKMLNTQISFRAPPAGCIIDRMYYMDFVLYPSGLRLHFMLQNIGDINDSNISASLSLTIGPDTVQELWVDNHQEIACFCLAYHVKDSMSCKQLKQRDIKRKSNTEK